MMRRALARQCLVAALAIATGLSSATAQDIDLSGRVLDQSGAGIAGASVSLVDRGLSTVTDSTGAYRITRLAAVSHTPRAGDMAVRLHGGTLSLSVRGQAAPVRVELFDLSGRLVQRLLDSYFQPGSYSVGLPLGRGAIGTRAIRVHIGNASTVLRASAGGPPTSVAGQSPSPLGVELSRTETLDLLRVSRGGYVTRFAGVQSWRQMMVVMLLAQDDLSIALNSGDLYTQRDSVTVTLLDHTRSVLSIRLTDIQRAGTPVFDTVNPRNAIAGFAVADTVSYLPWILTKGTAAKAVWAEVLKADSSRDTLVDGIEVRPYQMRIILRGDTAGALPVWRHLGRESIKAGDLLLDAWVLHRQEYCFSIDIGNDSSFADSFSVSLAFSPLDESTLSGYPLVQTRPMGVAFTGRGDGHDTSHEYRYCVDLDSADGRRNLSELYHLIDTTGITPLYADQSPAYCHSVFTSLLEQARAQYGRKEIALQITTHGRYFGERRSLLVSGRVSASQSYATYLDVYPPAAFRHMWEYQIPADGDTLSGALAYSLFTGAGACDSTAVFQSGYVRDGARAPVRGVELVIAEMSPSLAQAWVVNESWSVVTLDMLLSQPHYSYPLTTPVPQAVVCPVAWSGINTSTWTNGWHLVAIVTEDAYGNRGIAPMIADDHVDGRNTNPQHWYIVTDNHEY